MLQPGRPIDCEADGRPEGHEACESVAPPERREPEPHSGDLGHGVQGGEQGDVHDSTHDDSSCGSEPRGRQAVKHAGFPVAKPEA